MVPRVGGIVVCGGQSSRMGRPKAWLPFGNEVLLQRIVRILSEAVSPIVVVAASEQELPKLPGEVTVARDEETGRGPLQGLAAGLKALRGRVDAAYASSCDVPFLKTTFIRRMVELLGANAICIPRADEHLHPLAAVYRLEVEQSVRLLLSQNRLRPAFLLESSRARIVVAEELQDADPTLQSLRNINDPADYATALDELAQLQAR
ncbi:MAG: molybdenum cofactor guanylyltransferase [Planctomycetes bacterium]|nr:molybdenum cofactor guanylyltransferase [Planctomycetota bacterium]